MAKYRIKVMPDGSVRIWGRYQPFKGAATTSFIETVERGEVAAAVERIAEKVKQARNPRPAG